MNAYAEPHHVEKKLTHGQHSTDTEHLVKIDGHIVGCDFTRGP